MYKQNFRLPKNWKSNKTIKSKPIKYYSQVTIVEMKKQREQTKDMLPI